MSEVFLWLRSFDEICPPTHSDILPIDDDEENFNGDTQLELFFSESMPSESKSLRSTVDRRRPIREVGGELFAHVDCSDPKDEHGVKIRTVELLDG